MIKKLALVLASMLVAGMASADYYDMKEMRDRSGFRAVVYETVLDTDYLRAPARAFQRISITKGSTFTVTIYACEEETYSVAACGTALATVTSTTPSLDIETGRPWLIFDVTAAETIGSKSYITIQSNFQNAGAGGGGGGVLGSGTFAQMSTVSNAKDGDLWLLTDDDASGSVCDAGGGVPSSIWCGWDGSQWVGIGIAGGTDNLGNHTATTDLDLDGNDIVGAGAISGETVGGVYYCDQFTGADIWEKCQNAFDTAIAAGARGVELVIPRGTYTVTSDTLDLCNDESGTLNYGVRVRGQGAGTPANGATRILFGSGFESTAVSATFTFGTASGRTTITRPSGSWITDGFKRGDLVETTGFATTANNYPRAGGTENQAMPWKVYSVSATVLTLETESNNSLPASLSGSEAGNVRRYQAAIETCGSNAFVEEMTLNAQLSNFADILVHHRPDISPVSACTGSGVPYAACTGVGTGGTHTPTGGVNGGVKGVYGYGGRIGVAVTALEASGQADHWKIEDSHFIAQREGVYYDSNQAQPGLKLVDSQVEGFKHQGFRVASGTGILDDATVISVDADCYADTYGVCSHVYLGFYNAVGLVLSGKVNIETRAGTGIKIEAGGSVETARRTLSIGPGYISANVLSPSQIETDMALIDATNACLTVNLNGTRFLSNVDPTNAPTITFGNANQATCPSRITGSWALANTGAAGSCAQEGGCTPIVTFNDGIPVNGSGVYRISEYGGASTSEGLKQAIAACEDSANGGVVMIDQSVAIAGDPGFADLTKCHIHGLGANHVAGGGSPYVAGPSVITWTSTAGLDMFNVTANGITLKDFGVVISDGSDTSTTEVIDVRKCEDDFNTGGPPQTSGTPDSLCDSDGSTAVGLREFVMDGVVLATSRDGDLAVGTGIEIEDVYEVTIRDSHVKRFGTAIQLKNTTQEVRIDNTSARESAVGLNLDGKTGGGNGTLTTTGFIFEANIEGVQIGSAWAGIWSDLGGYCELAAGVGANATRMCIQDNSIGGVFHGKETHFASANSISDNADFNQTVQKFGTNPTYGPHTCEGCRIHHGISIYDGGANDERSGFVLRNTVYARDSATDDSILSARVWDDSVFIGADCDVEGAARLSYGRGAVCIQNVESAYQVWICDDPNGSSANGRCDVSTEWHAVTSFDYAWTGAHDFSSGTVSLPADAVNAITEIASAIKSGSDGTLITGTEGTSGNCAEWDANGDLVDSGGTCGGGGSAVILDIGDDGGNDSTDISEIATSGDTNGIVSEPSADKVLINMGNDWPKADVADAVTIADNESTDEDNAVLFTPGGTGSQNGNLTPESDGDLTYNPSTGTLKAPIIEATGGSDGTYGTTLNQNTSAIGEPAAGKCKIGFVGTTLNKHCEGGSLTSLEGGSGDVVEIAAGTAALGTSAISSGACATVVTSSATGVATTDVVSWSPNADISGVTGYAPVTTGALIIYPYPTANNVNFKVCNPTSSSITPGAVTLNWRVNR